MANKKTKAKGQQPARKNAVSAPAKGDAKKAVSKKAADTKKSAKAVKKASKPGFFGGIVKYFGSVRTEMKRVVWPTKSELVNYSIAVCASLVVVGIVIALLDFGIEGALAAFANLRG